jgi:hypothetical protein
LSYIDDSVKVIKEQKLVKTRYPLWATAGEGYLRSFTLP